MNYAFKLQSSTGVCSSVSTSKSFNSKNYVRAHCCRKYLNSNNYGRDFSAYTSGLKLLLKKRINSNQNANKKLVNEEYQKAKQFTDLLNLNKSKIREAKIKIHQMKPAQVEEFAEKPGLTFEALCPNSKYICDSTRSFDPNLYILSKEGIKRNKNENSSIKLSVQNTKISYKCGFLKSFPLQSAEVFPLQKTNKKNKIKQTSPNLEENNFNINNNIDQQILDQRNFRVQNQSKNIIKNFQKSDIYDKNFKKIGINFLMEEKFFIQNLELNVELAVNSNKLEEALHILSCSRKKNLWQSHKVKLSAEKLFGLVMNGYGSLGDWGTISEMRQWMKQDNINFNYQTYAAMLDCLGKISNENLYWHKEVTTVLEELEKMKYSINGIFTKTILSTNQRQNILNTIQKIYPNFEITLPKINLNSDCKLLSNLYSKKNNLIPQIDENNLDKSLTELIEEQLETEKNFTIIVKPIATNLTTINDKTKKNLKYLENLKDQWKNDVKQGFLQSLQIKKYSSIKPFLKCMPVDLYVDLIMEEVDNICKFSSQFTYSTNLLYRMLGEKVERRYEIQKRKEQKVLDNTTKLFEKYCDWYKNPSGPALNSRQQWQMILQENVNYQPSETIHFEWPHVVCRNVGKFLYEVIFRKIKINIDTSSNPRWVPVFYRIIRSNTIQEEQIKFHPKIRHIVNELEFHTLRFDTSQIPMLCPPKPWTSFRDGGYLSYSSSFYRKNFENNFKSIDLQNIPNHHLYAGFDSLNAIQNTPWKINEPVLDIILEIFKNGGCNKLDVAEFPEKVPPRQIPITLNAEEMRDAHKKYLKLMQQKKDKYGLWCEALYRLSLANHFRKRTFWLPYNFDFRGRLYPIPALINHTASDTFRALLLFGKGKPLGPKGLDWIKIHTVSLAGTHKKKSLDERLKYANSILPSILDSAKNPLTGDGWWKKSDEPWQTLAACFEIKKALDCSCPELFVSHLPIHQDGSCNGLQHYAALGKDLVGGSSVNLTPSSEPQDVYSVITASIEEKRLEDAEKGLEIAKILDGFVRRKVVKQTIMTTVYGVTHYGAKLQIAKQLNDMESFPEEYVWEASSYLAQKTFQSLGEMFNSAKEIQNWLNYCAHAITLKNKHIKWISPIGLPIAQPYSLKKKMPCVENGVRSYYVQPNRRKQKTAFPPNFIHSLDSCHLMLTALFCEQAGLTFASIHDCYWTHPLTVDTMNKICREQFLSLHSQPILDNLSKYFIEQFGRDEKNETEDDISTKIFQAVPKTGDLNLENVLKSVYFFS